MRCLVTGGTGFLGKHLVEQLVEAGHQVRALVRREAHSLERLGAELVRGDVLEPGTLATACDGVEAVLHLAGAVKFRGEPTPLFDLHVEGTRNVLEAASEAGVGRAIHMSSSGTIAVSQDAGRVATEASDYATDVVRNWPYYLSKIFAEKVALDFHRKGKVPVVVLNPSLLLGPGDETLGASGVILRHLNREIPAVPPGGINFIDVRDAAAATVSALTKGEPGQRYLLGGQNMTIEAFFVLMERVSGISAPTIKAPQVLNEWTAKVLGTLEDLSDDETDESVAYAMAGHYWYLDANKAQRELDFRPRAAEATLRDAIAWIRDQGPLPKPDGLLGTAVRGLRRVFDRG
jgi:dihydroflavonol-4-reductase